ncbi:MAPEG family protein [Afifella sp. IM 167]|uniref:MAPEG family protein n=1 Tax=Afifella sp. IM 167 TaxID=2033586 RepID=UPI001CCBCBDD|nr:MAPEG family protein [Afifella sp. IM 167]MBZ8133984.1 hypothetical protein [Afifella sp. IM 167]
MPPSVVLLPVFFQVGLTFFLGLWMGRSRFAAIRRGEVEVSRIALGEPNWPKKPLQIANSFANQFQIPLLFYVVVALALVTDKAGLIFVLLAYAFVASRFLHAFVHTGTNDLRKRFQSFAVGLFILIGMWLLFAIRTLFGI